MHIAFTDRELDVMSVLWDLESATVAEVRERLSDDLAYTTVLTVLRTLEQKDTWATPGRDGRTATDHS
jgi:predicted transcriptional regulator